MSQCFISIFYSNLETEAAFMMVKRAQIKAKFKQNSLAKIVSRESKSSLPRVINIFTQLKHKLLSLMSL